LQVEEKDGQSTLLLEIATKLDEEQEDYEQEREELIY